MRRPLRDRILDIAEQLAHCHAVGVFAGAWASVHENSEAETVGSALHF